MLCGYYDGGDMGRDRVVIFYRYLCLPVRTEIGESSCPAKGSKLPCQTVCQVNGKRHIIFSLCTGVSEHHALVTGAKGAFSPFLLQSPVHAAGDVGRLLVYRGRKSAAVCKTIFIFGISDLPDHISRTGFVIHRCLGRDLTHDVNRSGFSDGLACTAAVRILPEQFVKNPVGDLVADLIRMSFSYRFRSHMSDFHSFHPFC